MCGHGKGLMGLPNILIQQNGAQIKGGGGVKMSKKLSTWFMDGPFSSWNLDHMIQVKKIRYQKEMSHCRQHGKVVNK